jgi:hypothetical protein
VAVVDFTIEEVARLRASLELTTQRSEHQFARVPVSEVRQVLRLCDALQVARIRADALEATISDLEYERDRVVAVKNETLATAEKLCADLSEARRDLAATTRRAEEVEAEQEHVRAALEAAGCDAYERLVGRDQVVEIGDGKRVRRLAAKAEEAEARGAGRGRKEAFAEALAHVRTESTAHTNSNNEGGALALDILANWLEEKTGAAAERGGEGERRR